MSVCGYKRTLLCRASNVRFTHESRHSDREANVARPGEVREIRRKPAPVTGTGLAIIPHIGNRN